MAAVAAICRFAAQASYTAKNELGRAASKLTAKANVEIVMALAEDVPELGLAAYWLATGGLDAIETGSDASIVILSTLISIFHMAKCIQRYRSIVKIAKHAKGDGMCMSCDTRCCISDEDAKKFEEFELEKYGIENYGFMRESSNGFTEIPPSSTRW